MVVKGAGERGGLAQPIRAEATAIHLPWKPDSDMRQDGERGREGVRESESESKRKRGSCVACRRSVVS